VDREPEERRSYPRRPSDRSPSEEEEPFPHEEERPQDGLERTWWRRIFRGPHEEATERPNSEAQRPWWRRWLRPGR
jgi:hypothetical protein